MRRLATVLTYLCSVTFAAGACSEAAPSPVYGRDAGTVAVRKTMTRFSLALLVPQEALPDPAEPHRCAVPVRGQRPESDMAPEIGLAITASSGGTLGRTIETDSEGKGVLPDASPGIHQLELAPADGSFRVRFAVDLRSPRTVVYGVVDADPELPREEGEAGFWRVAIEVLPDADDDLVSDTGAREQWVFTAGGGTGYRHLENGKSELLSLDDDDLELVEYESADLDGDFVPDDADPDRDGDGVPNEEDADLPCPGFSHQALQAPHSAHQNLGCDQCHLAAGTRPLYCDDCHSPAGRSWTGIPASAPADHFQRGCEQCHPADQGWASTSGQFLTDHAAFPLTGAHLGVDCFTCHANGDVYGLPATCEGCHAADTPPEHQPGPCSGCHNTRSWVPGP